MERFSRSRTGSVCVEALGRAVPTAAPDTLCVHVVLQRVVKADIVNYSQDPVARPANPQRSSMCVVQ